MFKQVAAALLVAFSQAAQTFSIESEQTENGLTGTASFTYYDSYPACCPDNPNYNPKASTEECDDYSGCKYSGDFAAIGHKSFSYVKSNNLIAFYDNSDPSGKKFMTNYGGKQIKLTKGTVSFTAQIADTCGNGDCNNCCSKNSQPTGFLVDMEYYTLIRNFGSTGAADGSIKFEILGSDPVCDWPGHCKGDPCSTYNDCAGSMTCVSGKCS